MQDLTKKPQAVAVPRPGTPHHTAYLLAKDRTASDVCRTIEEIAPLVPEGDGRILASIACSAMVSSVMIVLVAAFGASGRDPAQAHVEACDFIQKFAEALRGAEQKVPVKH